jgi:hypothetical protein
MSGKKLITADKLRGLITQLKDIFVTKQDGKDLSTNDFTDEHKNVCSYAIPMEYEGVLSVSLLGPDGHIYRLMLNEDFRLTIEEQIKPRTVKYLISGDNYYYLTEDESGMFLTKYTGEEELLPEEVGYVRAISRDTRMKFTLNVEGENIVFNIHKGPGIDETEAKYMVCNDKICYFEIKDDQVHILYEYLAIETDNIKLK